MSVMIKQHNKDSEMCEIYTQTKNSYVLWGVVHSDMLSGLGLTIGDIENMEIELIIKPEST